MYGEDNFASIDIPEFMKDKNINIIDFGKDIDLTPIYESISKGIKGKDLAKFYNSLTKQDITRLTKFADDVCGKFYKYWQNYKEVK